MERQNSALSDASRQIPNFVVGNWAGLYSTAPTIRQGVKAGRNTKAIEANFALDWTRSYQILAVGVCPSSDTPDGSLLGDKLHSLDLPTIMSSADAHHCATVERCRPCANPHDRGDTCNYLSDGLVHYVLNDFAKKAGNMKKNRANPEVYVNTREKKRSKIEMYSISVTK